MSKNRTAIIERKGPRHIVCVGASAGGLEALISFLKSLPKKIDMAFVLIQHLEPRHKSALAEILSRETLLNIREAKNNDRVESSHIYVITPGTLLSVSRGRLKVTARVKRADGRYLPIDFFMDSLANDQKEKAIGIILSGTGSDGSAGAEAIKAKGGIIFAQDEKSARYYGMPSGVIASGSADFILKPEEIAQKLAQIDSQGFRKQAMPADSLFSKEGGLNKILVLLRELTGVDFIHYKQTTVRRRVDRQMSLRNIKAYQEYYDYLIKNPSETDILIRGLLISVTSFFRDPEVFAALKKTVYPLIVSGRSAKKPIRIWVPACSSGEEVYSIAISLYEFLEKKRIKPRIQIFGTDLSDSLVNKARACSYPETVSGQVSAERLRRFFVKTETGYKIAKYIREMCIFAKHDITNDPPLSNMDIASCRNLLIYLDGILQQKALSSLHYAINQKGFLILGTSESVIAAPGLFTLVDKKNKIYLKNIVGRRAAPVIGTPAAILKGKMPESRGITRKWTAALPAPDKPAPLEHVKMKRVMKNVGMPDIVSTGNSARDLAKLKNGFSRVVEKLNAISEEKDTFNEELKAANEEIQSSNEELQSMNEELETSKEELQSTNEELLSLNEELQNNNAELAGLNSDLNNVFASINMPLIIVGNDLRIKRFTPTARKVMNLISTDVDRPIGDIRLNLDITNLEDMILSVIEDMAQKESQVKDKEGRWYSMRIRPYRTLDNKIEGAVIALVDIDEIKRSKDELQGILNYTHAIIETMKEPLLVLDKDLHILSANKAYYDTFNVRPSDIENKLLYETDKRQWENPEIRKLLSGILRNKTQFNAFEMSFDIQGTGLRAMNLNGRQIKFLGKESQMILLVFEDITQRKKADDILKRDSETLEKIIRQRTQQLLELELRVERSKHLAATVAHELRNTLAAISVAVYNIKRKINDPRIERSIKSIDNTILDGSHIINNVLSYAKIKISHFEAVKINDILEACVEDMKSRFTERGISVDIDIKDTEQLLIEADRLQIKEVFFNILNNSVDSIEKDAGVIKIKSRIDGGKVIFVIQDNGEGIDKDDLANVMNPFFTTKAKGTGLGLAVCNQILMLHDGLMSIESTKGKFTAVTIALPINRKNAKYTDNR